MSLPSIADVPNLWNRDGSLRDIYFTDTGLEHWEKFLLSIQEFQYQYSFDGNAQEILSIEAIFSNREGHHILSIYIGGVTVNCHFFVVEEIELDIDPREVKGQLEHEAILKFIETLAMAIDRPASLAPENSFKTPFLFFENNERVWSIRG